MVGMSHICDYIPNITFVLSVFISLFKRLNTNLLLTKFHAETWIQKYIILLTYTNLTRKKIKSMALLYNSQVSIQLYFMKL